MTKVAIVDTEGEIIHLWDSGAEVEPEGAWETDKTKTVVHITSSIDNGYFMRRNYYKDSTWKSRDEKPGDYYNWKDEAWVLDSDALWVEIRENRNRRLYASDWTQLDDCKLSMSKKGEWTEYRQALRDVPANNSSVTDMDKVSWPTEPS